MPIYEYSCPGCKHSFSHMMPSKNYKEDVICPHCYETAKRSLSSFSFHSAHSPYSIDVLADKKRGRIWQSQRINEDRNKKEPDPMRRWREERCKTLKVGPERWQQWAGEVKTEETKKKTYGEAWTRREM